MFSTVDPQEALKNHLLATLPANEFIRIIPKLEPVYLKLGEVIYDINQRVDYLYFPTTVIVSLLHFLENGATTGVGVVGNEGAVGIELFMGGETTACQIIVHSGGAAFRMKAIDLQIGFRRGEMFQAFLLRFTMALLTQVSQTAVCYRLHSIEQQLCRLVLLTHDRLYSDKLVMTHDFIAIMLGVRREGITLAAHKLANKNLIKNLRGTITIIDRQGLEDSVCECYKVVKNEYGYLLGKRNIGRFG